MKLHRLASKSQLALALFLILALAVTGLAFAGNQSGGDDPPCRPVAYDSHCTVFGNSASCSGGPRWVLYRQECCGDWCTWKQWASGCGYSCFGG